MESAPTIEVRVEDESVWLTQKLIAAELFGVDVRTVNDHLKNIYAEGELTEEATNRKNRIVQKEGKREGFPNSQCICFIHPWGTGRVDDPTAVIQNWLRNRETIEFLGLWEELNNPNFKHLDFEGFRMEAGRISFVPSPKKWIESTGAIGIQSKSVRYGGTFGHVDIAMEFASWISPERWPGRK